MKKSRSKDVFEGRVIKCLPSVDFEVKLNNGHIVRAYLIKETAKYYVQLKPGARVKVELTTLDSEMGKIREVVEEFDPEVIQDLITRSRR